MRRGSRRWVMVAAVVLAGVLAALGLRAQEPVPADRLVALAPSIPGTPMTLAVFGTSLTARSQWPEAVTAGLEGCLDRPVRLVRVAEPGVSSEWGVGQVPAVVAAAPDVILMEFAINDADLRDGLSLTDSAANHRAIIVALQSALPEAQIVLLTMNPAQGLRGLMRPFLGRHYAAYGPIAADTGIGLVDLHPRWLRLPRGERGLADGLHPDDAVAQAVIVPAVLDHLGLMAGKACGPG